VTIERRRDNEWNRLSVSQRHEPVGYCLHGLAVILASTDDGERPDTARYQIHLLQNQVVGSF
jgi:hypothetical protein